MKKYIIALLFVFIVGCQPTTPTISTTDNSGSPTDSGMYIITGRVVADTESLTRQIQPTTGTVYGSGYGYFRGEVIDGKTFIRLQIIKSSPQLPDAENGQIVIIKGVDTKLQMVLPGDIITLKCRRDYEAVARFLTEEIDWEKQATWEIDYCRMQDATVRTK